MVFSSLFLKAFPKTGIWNARGGGWGWGSSLKWAEGRNEPGGARVGPLLSQCPADTGSALSSRM